MNFNLKLAVGTIAGGALGWFVGSVIVEYLHIKEEQKYHKYDVSEEFPEGTEADPNESEGPQPMSKTKPGKRDYTKNFDPMLKASLESLAKKYNTKTQEPGVEEPEAKDPEVEVDAQFALEGEPEETFKPQTGPIQIISLADFANSDTDYEQLTLTYYEDDVLTDANDEPLPGNYDKIVGPDALVSFGIMSQDEDVVYVRNSKLKAEYEIVRANKNYAAPAEEDRRPRKEKHDEEDT